MDSQDQTLDKNRCNVRNISPFGINFDCTNLQFEKLHNKIQDDIHNCVYLNLRFR